MAMESDVAKQALEGIVGLACKLSNASPKQYRIKFGGGQAAVDWYVSTQNADASINTRKAKELGLVRRTFGIYGEHIGSAVVLRVREWSATKQDDGYREVWTRPADDFKARQEFAKLLAQSMRELGPSAD